jgi:hypothetical protein
MPTMTRTPIPRPELSADLDRLGQTATVTHNAPSIVGLKSQAIQISIPLKPTL